MFTWRCATVSLSPKDDVYPAVIYPGNGQIWTVPPFQPPQWVKLGPKLTTHQLGIFHSPKWFIAHMPCTKIECCSCCSHIGGWSSTGWWFQRFLFFFPYIGNFIIPSDLNSMIFQRGRAQPPTSQSYQSMNRDLYTDISIARILMHDHTPFIPCNLTMLQGPRRKRVQLVHITLITRTYGSYVML